MSKKRKVILSKLISIFMFVSVFSFFMVPYNAIAASSTASFTDDFEDGNSTGWSIQKSSWAVITDGTNHVYYKKGTDEGRVKRGDNTWTNYSVEAKVNVDNFNGSNKAMVCGRYTDGNNYYAVAISNTDNGAVQIIKKVKGSSTILKSASLPISTGTWYTLKLDMNGSTLNAYVNGALKLTATDSSIAAGAVGLVAFKSTTKYDDVVVSNGQVIPPVTYSTPTLTPNTTAANVSSVTVTIDNFGTAPVKQYKIDDSTWQNYTSPIVVSKNCTIYAQGSDTDGNKSSIGKLVVSNIGVAPITYPTPTLTPNTTAANVTNVIVTIDNFGTAPVKQYKVDDGTWQNYTAPVTVTKNCTVYAQGSDTNGNKSTIGNLVINNIGSVTPPTGNTTVKTFDELKAAVASVAKGSTIEIAAPALDCTSQLVLDKVDSNITIKAAAGYTPILDFTSFREAAKKSSPSKTGDGFAGIRIYGGSYTIQGLIVQKAYDNGMLIKPFFDPNTKPSETAAGKPDNNTIINCVFRYNGDSGIQVGGSQTLEEANIHVRPNNTHVIGCVAYRNFDILTSGGNADGFAAKLYLGKGTIFSHCISAENSDDAWDSFGIADSDVTYEYCVAYHSGDPAIFTGAYDTAKGLPKDADMPTGKSSGNANGFKMGSGSSKYGDQTSGLKNLKNCLAVDNFAKGFDENNGKGTINITNGMALGNVKCDYLLDLMTAGTFENVQAFSAKGLKNPIGGTVSIVDASKQAGIRAEVDAAIAQMRQELRENKIPSYMNFSFWGGTTPPTPTPVTYSTPTLTPDTTAANVSSVKITIGNFGTAPIKQYKIDNDAWQDYTTPVVVNKNCTVYAQGSDANGNKSTVASLVISNIGSVTPPTGNAIYVGGTDGKTLVEAASLAKSGDTIIVRGTVTSNKGIYLKSGVTLKGELDSKGAIASKIDFSGSSKGIQITENGAIIKDLEICNSGDNGIYITGSGNHVINCIVHDNKDSGIQICNGGANNHIEYVYSHHNADSSGGNADGFACKLHSGEGNVFDHCIAESNSDDGFDLYAAHGAVTFISCKAINNGECYGKKGNGSGFKVGGVDNKTSGEKAHLDPLKHTLTDCYAEGNKVGFDRNNQSGIVTMTRCTSKSNTAYNFKFLLKATPSALGYEVTFGIANIDNCTSENGINEISGAQLIGTCVGFN
jgi:hypothetical protein